MLRRLPWTAWTADWAVSIVVSGAFSFLETRKATRPAIAPRRMNTPATMRNEPQAGSPSACRPVAAAKSSMTQADSRRNSSTAAIAAMMPILMPRAVISFLAMSIS